MSECVVRMEMPNGCYDCRLRNMVGNCPIPMFDGQDEEKIWTLEECFQRPPWCPIICSLPEGHGRLVDADAAYKAACEGADNWDGGCSTYRDDCIREEMDKVPTASPWRRVESLEDLPKESGTYIVYLRQGTKVETPEWMGGEPLSYVTEMAFDREQMLWRADDDAYNAILSFVDTEKDFHVTHWMDKPEPPKEIMNE